MSNFFDAKEAKIIELLNTSNSIYQIPPYQRSYQWQSDNVDKFYEDIKESLDNNKDYFIGSLVVTKYDNNNNLADIIDGQQRLTTIFLFLKALKDIIKAKEMVGHDNLTFQIDSCLYDISTEEPKLKINHKKNKKIFPDNYDTFFDIIQQDHSKLKSLSTESLYIKNYLHLYEKLDPLEKDEIKRLLHFLLYKVFFVIINCKALDEAIKIFDTINSTGINLSQSDIIKSLMMSGLEDKEMSELDDKWSIMEEKCSEVFGNDKNKSPMDIMMGSFMLSSKGLYTGSLRSRYEKGYKDSSLNIEELDKFVSESYSIFNEDCKYINALKVTKWENIWIPILVEKKKLINQNRKNNEYKKLKSNLVRLIYSYYLASRRADVLLPITANLIKDTDVSEINIDKSKLKSHIKIIKILLESKDVYSGADKKKCRALMYLLEVYHADDTITLHEDTLSLDHILPKSLHSNIDNINSVGNLVLMSKKKNMSLGNNNDIDKKINAMNESHLLYAKNSIKDEFSVDDIGERGKNISKSIEKVLNGNISHL